MQFTIIINILQFSLLSFLVVSCTLYFNYCTCTHGDKPDYCKYYVYYIYCIVFLVYISKVFVENFKSIITCVLYYLP
jgi:hypothetical protein